jgi:hypothetical protein
MPCPSHPPCFDHPNNTGQYGSYQAILTSTLREAPLEVHKLYQKRWFMTQNVVDLVEVHNIMQCGTHLQHKYICRYIMRLAAWREIAHCLWQMLVVRHQATEIGGLLKKCSAV